MFEVTSQPKAVTAARSAASRACPLPRLVHARLRKAGAEYYFWPDDPAPEGPADEMIAARFVCSWATTGAEVDTFLSLIR